VSYFVLYVSSPCLVGLAAEINKTVKLSWLHYKRPEIYLNQICICN